MLNLQTIFDNLLKSNDIIKCKYFILHVINYDGILQENYLHYKLDNWATIKEVLKSLINKIPQGDEGVVFSIYHSMSNNALGSNQLLWIENDEAACSFLWCYLIYNQDHIPKNVLPPINQGNRPSRTDNYIHSLLNKNWVNELKLQENGSHHEERLLSIKLYLNIAFLPINKCQLISDVKRHWKMAYDEVKNLKWLFCDNNTLEWAWDYLNKHVREQRSLQQYYSNFDCLSFDTFNPTNEKECSLAIYTALRIWQPRFRGEKRLLLQDINKAWRQRKFRAERENKKSLNCYLDTQVKNHLDELAKTYDKTIVDMVTYLIENEYRNSKR
ncbi:hypothetical protein [Providencia rustigianii]|uniref:hypothetical protein n=2 Tax=Providencia rustigianii TaxID=158850 RepID=UPI000F6F1DA4|nr:hypothetical protein [Providencia rustigianii]VEH56730.1 Uncharacterised protein [Providencia rustigianii]